MEAESGCQRRRVFRQSDQPYLGPIDTIILDDESSSDEEEESPAKFDAL